MFAKNYENWLTADKIVAIKKETIFGPRVQIRTITDSNI